MDKLDNWIESLDDDLHLGENEFGFTVTEQVENHNALLGNTYEYLRAGLNKLTKGLSNLN